MDVEFRHLPHRNANLGMVRLFRASHQDLENITPFLAAQRAHAACVAFPGESLHGWDGDVSETLWVSWHNNGKNRVLQDAGCFGEGSLGVLLRVFLVVIVSRNPVPLGNVDLPMVEWSHGLSSLYKYWEQGPLLRFVMICVQSLRLRCPTTLGEALE